LAWLSCDAVLPDRCHSASAKRSRGGFALAIPSRAMARQMGRVSSSISREIARHGGQGRYRALGADAQRPKPCHLAQHPALARMVAQKLRLNWSPQQITAWLERQFGNDDSRRVPHETIYRSLFIQTREVLKKSSLRTCVAVARCATDERIAARWAAVLARSSRLLRFASNPHRPKIERFRVIGKETSCVERPARRSRPWWNDAPAS